MSARFGQICISIANLSRNDPSTLGSSAFVSLKNSGLGRGQILRSLHPHCTPRRMKPTLPSAVSQFGAQAKAKLSNPAASGESEDQLRAPLEVLLADLAEVCGLSRSDVVVAGETALGELKTRPDYAVTVRNHLAGCRGESPRQGSRPAPLPGPRQGAVGKTPVPAEPALHRRQRVQPLAQRRTGRLGAPAGGRRRNGGRPVGSAAGPAQPVLRFFPVGTHPAPRRPPTGRNQRPALRVFAR